MAAPRYSKDMLLIDLFQANPHTAEIMTKLGFKCADCIVCFEDTVETAAVLHEKDLGALLEALNAAPEPKPEESMGWKLAEKVKALEDAHFAAVEKGRAEIAAALAEAGPARTDPARGKELDKTTEKVWGVFSRLLKAQAAYEKQRAKLLAKEAPGAAEEFVLMMLQARQGHPDVVSLLLAGIERRPAELAGWAALFEPPPPPAAASGPANP